MLKNEFKSIMQSYNESKETIKTMIDTFKKEEIDDENGIENNEVIDFEDEREELQKELNEMENEFKSKFAGTEKLKDKPSTINGIKEKLKEDMINFDSKEDKEKISKKIIDIEESLNLKRLIEYKSLRNKKLLKKDFKYLGMQVQSKLAKNSNYVFDTCYHLNKKLKILLNEEYKEHSKVITSFIYEFIISKKINEQAIFIYFFLNNIYNFDTLEEENKVILLESVNKLAEKII